jgi:hypothetical protein
MTFKIIPKSHDWWFWMVTLVLFAAALLGWAPGYYGVVAVSAANLVFKLVQKGGLSAFAVQTRVVYLLFTLPGLWPVVGFWWYLALFGGTAMAVFFDRCTIASVLRHAPWNRDRVLQVN